MAKRTTIVRQYGCSSGQHRWKYNTLGPQPAGLNTYTAVGGTRAVTAKQQLLWPAKEVLIIDEISMVPAQLLGKTERECRRLRCDEKPWGGIMAVIACGDFLQFPPVNARNAHPVWKPEKVTGIN
jgi:hypothetical protein